MPDVDNPDAVQPDDNPSGGDATAAENTARLDSLRSRWESDPTSKIYLQLAEEYRKAGRIDEAVEVLETSLEHRPRDPRGRVALARCRLELGDAAAAAELLEHVTRQDPAHVVANKLQLEAYLQLGDIDKATERLNLYRLLNDRDPELDHFVYRLERLRETPPTNAVAAEELAEPAAADAASKDDEPSDVITIDEVVSAMPPPVESFQPDTEPALELEMIEDSPAEDATAAEATAAEPFAEESVAEEPLAEEPTAGPSVEFEAVEIPTDEPELEWVAEDDEDAPEAIEVAPDPSLAVPTPEPAFDAIDDSAADDDSAAEMATPTFDDIETSPVATDEPTFDDIETSPAEADEPTFDSIEESPRAAEEPAFEALSNDHAELTADAPAPDTSSAESFAPTLHDDPVPVAEDADDIAPADADALESAAGADGSGDLFDVAPPPAPDLDDLFGLASLPPAPAPSLDALWGDASDADETEPHESASDEDDSEPAAPSREAATVTLGQLYLEQGHLDEAERIFHEVLDRDPEHAAALDGLTEVRTRIAADATSTEDTAADDTATDDTAADVTAADDTVADDEAPRSEAWIDDPAAIAVEATAEDLGIAPESVATGAQPPDATPLDEFDDEEDTAVSQAIAIHVPPVESAPVGDAPVEAAGVEATPVEAAAEPSVLLDEDDDEEDTAVSQAVAIQTPAVEAASVEDAPVGEDVLLNDDEEDTAVSRAIPTQAAGDGLHAATLLADRTIDTLPEGLTAKKILVLRQYARHLRQAAEHVQ